MAVQTRIRELNLVHGQTEVEPADRPRFAARRKKIADTIASMDSGDPTQFTDLGKPRVSVVNRLAGLTDISSAEIAEVLRQMKAIEAAAT